VTPLVQDNHDAGIKKTNHDKNADISQKEYGKKNLNEGEKSTPRACLIVLLNLQHETVLSSKLYNGRSQNRILLRQEI